MINGIPAIIAYYDDNDSYIPSDTVLGADQQQIQKLFDNCLQYIKNK